MKDYNEQARILYNAAKAREVNQKVWCLKYVDYSDLMCRTKFFETLKLLQALGLVVKVSRSQYKVIS